METIKCTKLMTLSYICDATEFSNCQHDSVMAVATKLVKSIHFI
jgi:hypothetical protein